MKAVTIDNLDLKDHVRWAQDQDVYDASFITESTYVAMQPEINGTSLIYSSKLEDLFEFYRTSQPWAAFSPPQNFPLFSKRYFSYRLFLNIYWEDKEENEDEDASEEEVTNDLIYEVKKLKKFTNQSSALFEKDKTTILNLLESIQWVNGLLKQICGRKMQYQKG